MDSKNLAICIAPNLFMLSTDVADPLKAQGEHTNLMASLIDTPNILTNPDVIKEVRMKKLDEKITRVNDEIRALNFHFSRQVR
jgi:hypothetical protein